MLGLIITIALFIVIIILVYIYLGKLSGVAVLNSNNEEMSQQSQQAHLAQQANNSTDIRNTNRSGNSSSGDQRDFNPSNTSNTTGRINMGNYVNASASNTHNGSSNETDLMTANTSAEPKGLTKKDQRKMEKKKVKEENREYQKMMLEEKKMREEAREKEYRDKEMKREEERRQEEELLKKLKEEQEKKENEVYNQWKDQFEIHEEGEEVGDFSSESMINDFLNYIKIRKVVSLEDLSGVYKIHPNDLVERLTFLEAQGRITGIVDDRGKYIYLTEKELAAIEKIFLQRGRISKAELIKECNKIIRFEPSEDDKLKILEEQKMEWKKLEEQMNNK
jgi:hypothetical protein